jgi:hypothetical protein
MLFKKYLILLLIFTVCISMAFAQKSQIDLFDNWHLGIGIDPFDITDGPSQDGYPGTDGQERRTAARSEADEDSEEGHDSERSKDTPASKLTFRAGTSFSLVPLQFVSRGTAEHQDNLWVGTGAGMSSFLSVSGNYESKFGFRTDISVANTGGSAFDVRLGGNANIWLRSRRLVQS